VRLLGSLHGVGLLPGSFILLIFLNMFYYGRVVSRTGLSFSMGPSLVLLARSIAEDVLLLGSLHGVRVLLILPILLTHFLTNLHCARGLTSLLKAVFRS